LSNQSYITTVATAPKHIYSVCWSNILSCEGLLLQEKTSCVERCSEPDMSLSTSGRSCYAHACWVPMPVYFGRLAVLPASYTDWRRPASRGFISASLCVPKLIFVNSRRQNRAFGWAPFVTHICVRRGALKLMNPTCFAVDHQEFGPFIIIFHPLFVSSSTKKISFVILESRPIQLLKDS
jgi:hypothetical protein